MESIVTHLLDLGVEVGRKVGRVDLGGIKRVTITLSFPICVQILGAGTSVYKGYRGKRGSWGVNWGNQVIHGLAFIKCSDRLFDPAEISSSVAFCSKVRHFPHAFIHL